MKIAVAYGGSTGVHRLRAGPLAHHLDCPLFDTSEPVRGKFDTIVLVKRPLGEASHIRGACDRLIWDPLDSWRHTRGNSQGPEEFWREECGKFQPDMLLATSPSCRDTMVATGMPVHVVPHAADPLIDQSWGDPDGPIVYYGYPDFVGKVMAELFNAAWFLGRRFVPVDFRTTGIEAMRGASMHVCLRWKPHDYALNRHCKPQVKLENAAAAGVPVLASNHPCVASSRPEAFAISHKKAKWVPVLKQALESTPLANPYTMDQYVRDVEAIITGANCAG